MDGHQDTQPSAGEGQQEQDVETSVQTMDLKILSPSSELPPAGLQLENLPTSTTIGELRSRITATLATHPPLDRQRLIYLGRVLHRDNDTLATIFGDNAISQQRQHTLHLVLRDGAPQPHPQPHLLPLPIAAPAAVPVPVPSSLPRTSGVFAPSSIPRPSSVPPRGTGAASPFRPATWTPQTIPNTSSPSSAANTPLRPAQAGQPLSQSQSRAQTPGDQQGFRSVFGNANIRANITANGQPVNLPPEVINQLLNQHLLRNGGLPDLFANAQAHAQPRPQQPEQNSHVGGTPLGAPSPPSQQGANAHNPFQQFMASVTVGPGLDGQRPPVLSAGNATNAMDGQSNQSDGEERGRSVEQGAFARTVTLDGRHQPGQGQAHPHPPFHPHPQMPQMQLPFPFPQGFPMPMMPMQPGMPVPMAAPAPVAGLRPQGTPRSASPARSVSEGPRRVGTPAAELQHRLMHTNQEIQNLNQLLGVLAQGTMANGQPAPPLSEEQTAQIRSYAESMNAHIDGFGNDLNALANAHPSVRFQPEFAGLNAMFHTVQGQGRGISQRIEGLTGGNSSGPQSLRQDVANSTNAATSASPLPQIDGATATAPSFQNSLIPPAQPITPSTTSDTLSSPSGSTRNNSPAMSATNNSSSNNVAPHLPATPELHLLSDPTNSQHYLLVGPTGAMGTGQLPLDVLYPLLAAQLPHDQLVRDFNRAVADVTRAIGRQDLRATLTGGLGVRGSAQQRQRCSAQPASGATGVQASTAAPIAAAVGGAQGQPADVNAPPQQPGAVPNVPGRQALANRPPDEMRDMLAPVIRNIWLIIRLAMFGWFFFSSGRGYGRLVVLGILGGIVWAVNAGVLGDRVNGLWEGIRRHFEEVVEEARGQRAAAVAGEPAQGQTGNGEGSSRAAMPRPEDTARRLMVNRAEGQRQRIRDTIRQMERTIALCFASLWPGVGEAVVRNHERVRREAEEERKKQEEEAKNKLEAAVDNPITETSSSATVRPEDTAVASGADTGDADRVNKGKERAQ